MLKIQQRRMNRRKKWKMFMEAFRVSETDVILKIYLGYFVFAAILIYLAEPSITSIADSLWYCFSVATTVGFGDIAALTIPGRIVTVILSIYSLSVVAIITAVITGFFLDMANIKASEKAREFLYDLEHLPELSKEELQDLSDRVKAFVEMQDKKP